MTKTQRSILCRAIGAIMLTTSLTSVAARAADPAPKADAANAAPLNIAPAAKVNTSFVSGSELLAAVNDGFDPRNSQDHSRGAYGNWPQKGKQWVEYEWTQPVSVNAVDVYWWDDHQGVHLPTAARLSYWDGNAYAPVDAKIGVEPNHYNNAKFNEVKTTKLRLEFDGEGQNSTGILEFKVFDSGSSPAFPPIADAGHDRVDVMPAPTYLMGSGRGVRRPNDPVTGHWSKASGPGDVTFGNADAVNTTATFTQPGEYDLAFAFSARGLTASDTVHVSVQQAPQQPKLNAVYVSHYKINSPFWDARIKNEIVNWIPHCIAEIEDPNLREGGLNNLIEAGKKNRGEPAKPHVGYPFSNAWVLNTIEAMCVALTVDPQGDADIIKAQDTFREKLNQYIPIILAAQEKDGYFQTRFTLGTPREVQSGRMPQHWNPQTRSEHEGYVGGYFIEMGIASYIATDGKERRLYDAAKRLADCWCDHIGPGKQSWYDGHQEIEQALVRLGRFVDDKEGGGKGQKYIQLAKFLLDQRGGQPEMANAGGDNAGGDFFTGRGNGSEYDQSHLPIVEQYTAVGHAVRASYTYSAMADVAMETKDPAYWSAISSIWDNIVNRKLYVTGGIGSGETSEGFGKDYSLPSNSAYCESCSNCGMLFMQYKLNLATHDAKYADLYETTLYNAILGDVDLAGQNFTYTNSLDSGEKRYKWHACPCCVGNIPRTLLMLPTWMYATSDDAVFVNLFAGSTVSVGKVGGADLEMVQATDYPWNGHVAITVNPSQEASFTVNVRSPKRDVSTLYTLTPSADGVTSVKVNGQAIEAKAGDNGYIAINRSWKAGDKIEIDLPLPVQTITASDKVAATKGRVAIQRGPLVYNIESVDGDVNKPVGADPKLDAKWSPDLLGGVMSVHGAYADGSPLQAIPNYARLNRGGRSLVWMKQQ